MSDILDRLSGAARESYLKLATEGALRTVADNIDKRKPRRFISGIAISSRVKNANDDAFLARGLSVTLPVALLADHNFMYPIGRVTGIHARGDAVHFVAEIQNNGYMHWAEDAWASIVSRFATRVSVAPRNLENYIPRDRTLFNWTLDELSVCTHGADEHARIQRCWQDTGIIYLDDRKSRRDFWYAP